MTEPYLYPLLMQPQMTARPWGGDLLKNVLGKDVPADERIGEAWELSDHPDGRSRIANGPWAGRDFGELVRQFPQLLKLRKSPERYPLLVKYIDAAEDLSIQVHPSDATAPEGERGKTECWFIMHAEPGAQIIYGLRAGVDAAELRAAAAAGGDAMERCIERRPVAGGDFVFVPAGTVHAILGGTLLCEIQQSSNTTYRLWDWNRQPPRPLHIEESLAVTTFDTRDNPPFIHAGDLPAQAWHVLTRNEYFEVQTLYLNPNQTCTAAPENRHGLIVCIPEGSGELQAPGAIIEPLKTGQTWFIPAGIDDWTVTAGEAGLRLLVASSLELD